MAKPGQRKPIPAKTKHKAAPKHSPNPQVRHMRLAASVTPESAKHDMHVRLVRTLFVVTTTLVAIAASMVVSTSHLATVPYENELLAGPPANGKNQTTLESLRNHSDCGQGLILNVVAHEDDDILFMNPHIASSIAAQKCIRTIYVTAGDDGQSSRYWQDREQGIEAAYAYMYDTADTWSSRTATMYGHPLEVAYLDGKPDVALLFLHLPDGSPDGKGFAKDNGESLSGLRSGTIRLIHSVDGKASYTRPQFILMLRAIMTLDKPDEINTQAYQAKLTSSDHSDHQAVGYFTDLAQTMYATKHTFNMYFGYQLNSMPVNLSDEQVAFKRAVFATYEHYDLEICQGFSVCANENGYENYLQRQYTITTRLTRY